MGLDMYAVSIPVTPDLKDTDQDTGVEGSRNIGYWRKFNNLHGYMHGVYLNKGGLTDDFNCASVRLIEEDIDALWHAAPHLNPTSGFFFGSQEPMNSETVDEVWDFCHAARKELSRGRAVYYYAWY